MNNVLKIGKTGSATVSVNESNIASAVESGALPVFSTPSMVALMEKAACNCIADALDSDKGETSVGTKINVSHIAASALGATITAEAEITVISGKRIDFSVTAHEGDKTIGEGTHTRIVIDSAKFMSKL